jgi:glycosyltransferase involved in cell wall biosynthesis
MIIDYLKENFEVEQYWDDSWQGKPFIDLSFIDKSYLGVVFLQTIPSPDELSKINNDNLIFIPMYDSYGELGSDYWMQYKDLKIFNFSKTLFEKLHRWGFETEYVQYFPKPKEFTPGDIKKVYFWQRTSTLNINTLAKLFENMKIKIHIHKAVDPNHKFTHPTKRQEKDFSITYSDWFKTRKQMWKVTNSKGIYVAPRATEGIGLAFLEAMAMGKAVVAPDNPTMNEYIVNNKTGYLYDLRNPQPLNLQNIESVQQNAYQYMVGGYRNWEKHKSKILSFIMRK